MTCHDGMRQLRRKSSQHQVSIIALVLSLTVLQYAGNVIVFGHMSPCDGDWFGGVNEHNAATFLKSLVEMEVGVLSPLPSQHHALS